MVIDQSRFPNVFEGYSLQWFDARWSRLVPDMRWFPATPGRTAAPPGDSSVPVSLSARGRGRRVADHEAPDGVVIDQSRFPNVFEGYSLQWFDARWSRLV
ncbi:hypothetical protein CTI14_58780, partial [Methylobacterium radiotolerans]